MLALYGIKRYYTIETYIDGVHKSKEEKTLIALFTTKEKAEEYVNKSYLKMSEQLCSNKFFKNNSLLKDYQYCVIKRYRRFTTTPPINPEIK